MNSEVQANLLHVEELLDANKVDECSLWDTVILGQCKYLLFCSLLHPNSSINGSAMPSHAFIFVYPMPPKSVQHGTSTRCLCTANSNKLTNCPRGTIMTASMHWISTMCQGLCWGLYRQWYLVHYNSERSTGPTSNSGLSDPRGHILYAVTLRPLLPSRPSELPSVSMGA